MNWEALLNWKLLLQWPGPETQTIIWLTQVFVVVFCTVSLNFVMMRVLDILTVLGNKTASKWDDVLIEALRLPLRLVTWVIGLSVAAEMLYDVSESALFEHVGMVRRVAFIAIIAMFANRLITGVEHNLTDPGRMKKPMDTTTAAAVSKLLRVSVIITSLLIILQALGYSVSGVLAFGGIGGMAVAFAAKDLLANFFGGMMIYMDKPFKVGEWVRSPDRTIEGTVEHIGWRLTRIRTFDQRPLYIPNSLFTTIVLENPSRMFNRRINEKIGIRYNDWRKMPAIVADVRQMLIDHDDIETDARTLIVNFDTYGASHIEFFIYTFTKTTNWVRFHEIKQDVLMKIMEIVEQHGAEFAFPTRTLHMVSDDDQQDTPPAPAAEEAQHAHRG
ncbi:mechanosensitive ion channel family protein [Alloalcanivorax xenomutans]|jgi:MscS family membrane protein|uniref:Mechanosensitive ion channel family protein n=1 Tax=Alloalcanivorax xenomutans TaxID=1094342 RepID=A0A9Q3ZFB1_9GAMM|nr:mechanosensitive ion channel family protein [Alloalcanivorax xenomutans]ERS14571.1 mechanosensitive ion channel protein MscS [Alcanivorax sp. PN-3]MBA4722704.1 mechanosensitive ion channel family protein [Alcanivorax sp.]ARB45487.1 mechanosensitive ion channel protein MscS [Alloalcanivorax xenomutans]MCE7507764.1 mechanosensitive ion channel family protein [Alloalcanivorax xenomutans]MCE7523618.1 mechanosensitive ion channel family protein [Alloalcanivorax xenomutans]